MRKQKKELEFTWTVFLWDFNMDVLKPYDVGPRFIDEYNRLKKKDRPATREAVEKFLESESRYHFWAKCEYEIIMHAWPMKKAEAKVDIYEQLHLNWNVFVDQFCNAIGISEEKEEKKNGKVRKDKTA